jgi:hypothetical protein
MRAFDFDALARAQGLLFHLLKQPAATYAAHLHPSSGVQRNTTGLTPLERKKHGGLLSSLELWSGAHTFCRTFGGVKREKTVL